MSNDSGFYIEESLGGLNMSYKLVFASKDGKNYEYQGKPIAALKTLKSVMSFDEIRTVLRDEINRLGYLYEIKSETAPGVSIIEVIISFV